MHRRSISNSPSGLVEMGRIGRRGQWIGDGGYGFYFQLSLLRILMTRVWFRFLSTMAVFMIVTLGGIGILNFTVDPAHVLSPSTYEKALAEILRSGHNASGVTNYDDRLLQRYLVEGRWPAPDVIALGSSRSYKWRARHFQNRHSWFF